MPYVPYIPHIQYIPYIPYTPHIPYIPYVPYVPYTPYKQVFNTFDKKHEICKEFLKKYEIIIFLRKTHKIAYIANKPIKQQNSCKIRAFFVILTIIFQNWSIVQQFGFFFKKQSN